MNKDTPEKDQRLRADCSLRRVSLRLFQGSAQELYVDYGDMNVKCGFCKALHFADERLQNSSVARS